MKPYETKLADECAARHKEISRDILGHIFVDLKCHRCNWICHCKAYLRFVEKEVN